MRKVFGLAGLAAAVLVAGCASNHGRAGPDEFAVAREAPLTVPPDFALAPPKPGAARPQDSSPATQALDVMFGGPAPRSASESAAIEAAGAQADDPGIRSAVGDTQTQVVDKGATTRDIVAAPQGDGQSAKAAVPQ